MEHSCPVVLDETQPVVIVNDPFSLRFDLCVLDLPSLLLDPGVVKSVNEADLQENSPEKGEVVIVSEADHSTEHVILRLLLPIVVQVCHIEHFRDSDKGFEHTCSIRDPVWPIHVECQNFWELRSILDFQQIDIMAMVTYAFLTFYDAAISGIFLLLSKALEELSNDGLQLGVFPSEAAVVRGLHHHAVE